MSVIGRSRVRLQAGFALAGYYTLDRRNRIVSTLKDRIVDLVRTWPGLTDREITDRLLGASEGQQAINQVARALAGDGSIVRRQRSDGKLANYPGEDLGVVSPKSVARVSSDAAGLSEDDVKRAVEAWLKRAGWQVTVAWGRTPGIDIEARKEHERWIIEAKGCGSLDPMRVNYFIGMLGELLQRMNDPTARYSIAVPDMKQFRGLWQRLPELAKSRARISAIFVGSSGRVEEVGGAG